MGALALNTMMCAENSVGQAPHSWFSEIQHIMYLYVDGLNQLVEK